MTVSIALTGCVSSAPESSANAPATPATLGEEVDLFATTVPDLAAVVPTIDVTERFLTEADLPGWDIGELEILPPAREAPAGCGERTDAEVAIGQFDEWARHRVSMENPDVAVFQLMGVAPNRDEAADVVERLGTMSCLGALRQSGFTDIESGRIENVPDGVTVAAFWDLTHQQGSQFNVIALLDNDVVLMLGMTASSTLDVTDLEPTFERAVLRALAG